jgi:hypothetical protein
MSPWLLKKSILRGSICAKNDEAMGVGGWLSQGNYECVEDESFHLGWRCVSIGGQPIWASLVILCHFLVFLGSKTLIIIDLCVMLHVGYVGNPWDRWIGSRGNLCWKPILSFDPKLCDPLRWSSPQIEGFPADFPLNQWIQDQPTNIDGGNRTPQKCCHVHSDLP